MRRAAARLRTTTFLALATAAAGVLVARPAAAQIPDPPIFSALIPFEERLDVKGCEASRAEGVLEVTVRSSGRVEVETELGVLLGRLRGIRGRTRLVEFDAASLALLAEYLAAGASAACAAPVTLDAGEIRVARLRLELRRGVPTLRFELRSRGVISRSGRTTRLRHRIRGRGEAELFITPQPSEPPPAGGGGGGVVVISPSRV